MTDLPDIVIESIENDDWMKALPHYKDELELHRLLAEKYDESLSSKGGPGSGNYGHAGRPGLQGGSSTEDVSMMKTPVDTPEFKAWFKNSKVVDNSGVPMVVYHGTPADFEVYDPEKANDVGFHFGTPEQADFKIGGGFFKMGIPYSEGVNVQPVYLSIQNPLPLKDHSWDTPGMMIVSLQQEGLKIPKYLDALAEKISLHDREQPTYDDEKWNSLGDYQFRKAKEKWWADRKELRKQFKEDTVKAIEENGYDGIVYSNEVEGVGKSFIAFRQNQIKSLFNRSFDPSSVNITKGGPGSGNYGHAGRVGIQGGSAAQNVSRETLKTPNPELAPLVRLARNYDTFRDFENDYVGHQYHGIYYHLTRDKNFIINPKQAPRDASSMSGENTEPGFMVTTDLDNWISTLNYDDYGKRIAKPRRYVAIIELGGKPNVDYKNTSRGFGMEIYVNKPELARVIKVVPVPEARKHSAMFYDDTKNTRALFPNSEYELENLWKYAHAYPDEMNLKGGIGSGNFGHSGRPGLQGGSQSQGVNLTKAQEGTPAFKKWFGKSQVVNDDGSPTVVYHGTREKFDTFSAQKSGGMMFFAQNPQEADYYGERQGYYLKSEKLLDLLNIDYTDKKTMGFIKAYGKQFDEWIDRSSGEEISPAEMIEGGYLYDYESTGSGRRWRQLFKFAEGKGYDGVKVMDVTDGVADAVYVVFNPNQIKNADINSGTFNLEDPNTLKGGAGSGNYGHAGRTGIQGGSQARKNNILTNEDKHTPGIAPLITNEDDLRITYSEGMAEEYIDNAKNVDDVIAKAGKKNPYDMYVGMYHQGKLDQQLKQAVALDLAERTGFDSDITRTLIKTWSKTSNDSNYQSLLMQKAVSEEFGVEMTPWQQDNYDKAKAERDQVFGVLNTPGSHEELFSIYVGEGKTGTITEFDNIETGHIGELNPYFVRKGFKSDMDAARFFARKMYESTQADLAKRGVEYVVLSRGTTFDKSIWDTMNTRQKAAQESVGIATNAASSWSSSIDVAKSFVGTGVKANERYGGIFGMSVPRTRILSTPLTGWGCLDEKEFVILGNSKDRASFMDYSNPLPLSEDLGAF